ncbi:NADPH-dependent F420 reductase [Duganella callida]|uniref:NADP oxidoreductase n=1 Tax=Duganella callida TaxID=2561932 RepID=A0A4Y9SGB4_9BURK|nr:NAD(P)-binding domain-containing protein [Duganella callida]TFW20624.1 NADP oxidoreductase [Duganella callida]
MNIAIIGAGAIGSAIARALSARGIPALIANSRGAASLAQLAAGLPGITPAGIEQAARADLVFLAVPWSKIPAAVRDLGPWNGRIVVDANNPIEAPAFQPIDLGGRASSAVIADLLPGARVVKAFNHLLPALLAGDPRAEGGRRVLFLSGDDAAAKTVVASLIDQLGFFALDLGGVEAGRMQQFPGGPLPALNLVKFP